MPVRCTILALFLAVSAAFGADVTNTKGGVDKGDLVAITDKEIVLLQDGKRVPLDITGVLKVQLRAPGSLPPGAPYARVELTDGSQLNCAKWNVKRKEAELTLVAGPVVKVPLDIVAHVLNKAHVPANRADWKSRVASRKKANDVLVVVSDGRPRSLSGTLGEGDEKGETIEFAIDLDGKIITRKPKQAEVFGLIFRNTLDAKAPPIACKVVDNHEDVIVASGVTLKDGIATVQTPAGARINFRTEDLALIDYSKGKLEYLSDLDPSAEKSEASHEAPDNPQRHLYRDSNVGNPDPSPITLGGVAYPKGVTLRPYVEVTYDLKGEYREFSAVVGVDDRIPIAEGAVELVIELDGRPVRTFSFAPRDAKKFEEVKINVKDARRLRLVARSKGKFDNIKHVSLGDAKVTK
jgi:hypothetical protein